jgi:hypothetical protein
MRADARLSGSPRTARRGSDPVLSLRPDEDDGHLAPYDYALEPMSKWDKKVWFVVEGLTKSFQARFSESKRLPRIVGEIARTVLRDGDGDELVTNPFTGRDDMPMEDLVDLIRDKPELLSRLSERINERLTETIGKNKRPRKGASPSKRTTKEQMMVGFLSEQFDMVFGRKGKPSDSVLKVLSERDMGFTISPTSGKMLKEGYAIARPGRGLRVPASAFYDDNGNPTDVGIDALMMVLAANIDEISKPQDGAKRVALGGWHSPKKHDSEGNLLDEYGLPVDDPRDAAECEPEEKDCITFIYLDVTDIFDEKKFTDSEIFDIGKKRNQQSVARLSAISSGNYTSINATEIQKMENEWAFLDTEGTGMDVLGEEVVSGVAEGIVGETSEG